MNKLALIFFALLLSLLAGSYYFFFYPPTLLKRSVTHSLNEVNEAFATKDSKQIIAKLNSLITDDGQIDLEVKMYSISQINGSPVEKQAFDKTSFVSFVDNIIYSLKDYGFTADLDEFNLSNDHKSTSVTFTTKAWGDGISYYDGVGVNMRFNTESTCEANVLFSNQHALLSKMHCAVQMTTLPKPGEENKLSNPDALRSILR